MRFAPVIAVLVMCGIAGIVYRDFQRPADPAVLQRMGRAIRHRGPDGEGVVCCGPAGLVHRRLAIIDVAGGHQPIANEDDSIHVVFNGEIYNYRKLRDQLTGRGHRFRTRSDTEVLVHLYEELGSDLVQHLRGMFAFAIWDDRRQQLLLARDHVGQKPLYVYQDHEKILFGSEIKAILAHPGVDRTIDPAAVEDYLTFGFIPGARSIFEKIRRLPAAHTLQVRHGIVSPAKRYWRLSFVHEEPGSDREWAERIEAAVTDSVRSHLVADVPVGAFLSGGLDSSLIVSVLSGLVPSAVPTFSIGFHERQYSELPYAAQTAAHCGTRHTEQIVTAEAVRDLNDLVRFYDEPFADASAIPTMAVSRLAASHVKVVLSGDGGDEAFGGYSRYRHDLKEAAIRRMLPMWFRRRVLRPLSAVWPKADWLPRPLRVRTLLENLASDPAAAYANTVSQCRRTVRRRLLHPDLARHLSGHRPEDIVERACRSGARDCLSGMLAADTGVLLPDDFLTKVDRASMAFGLEVRPPLLDVPLLELAASMPSSQKVRDGQTKWILKHIWESRLPPGLARRRKQGFELPVDEWLRGPLREQIQDVVLQPGHPIAECISVREAGRLFDQHCRRTGQHGQILWSLLVLGRWLETWAKEETEAGISFRRQAEAVVMS